MCLPPLARWSWCCRMSLEPPTGETVLPGWLSRVEVHPVQRHVPVRDEDLEPSLLLTIELRAVGIHLLDELFVGRRRRRVGRDDELDGKGPVAAPVAVELGDEGAHRPILARLLAGFEQRVVIALEQIEKLVLKAPLHRVEVPRRLRL